MDKMEQSSWFEKNPKKTLFFVVAFGFLIILLAAEIFLRQFWGFGNPVLYDSNPLYGYRPIPNQKVSRFSGSLIAINNLGLRANQDWDETINNKILFLGNSITYGGSYISNTELFSFLALDGISGYVSGNAGVNAWGVENIYGLIIDCDFLPAKIYVSVLHESDFYRGLTRLHGQPFWCVKPIFAFKELLYFFYYTQMNKRYLNWDHFVDRNGREKIVEKAVKKLSEMNSLLKSGGFYHLIYISPSRDQVLGKEPKDEILSYYLKEYNVGIVYILDKINSSNLNIKDKRNLFHDGLHLSKQGHVLWGKIINEDLKVIIQD